MEDTNHAIIIGSMRSGTTSLYKHLSDHTRVCPSKVKEPEFFSKKAKHGIKVDDYEDLWEF